MWKVLLVIYGVMSVITFAAYGLDKWKAASDRWRIRERTLHLLAALGGVPGALLGQQVFRHKRRKGRFMAITWLIAAGHAAGWVWWWMR